MKGEGNMDKINSFAILDIGKTNKKICIYDQELKMIDSKYKSFPAKLIDGLEIEDIEGIEQWLIATLKDLSELYNIEVISISTHGATMVCIDKNGNAAVPPVAYTNEVDLDVHDKFFNKVGSPLDLQRSTATAELRPLINIGKLIYFLQTKYESQFKNVDSILFYPQYFAYKLTGKISTDYTYAGCHTYLWDFEKSDWSKVADTLNIRDLLPKDVKKPTEVLGTIKPDLVEKTGLSPDTKITYGIHDSNASLVPFLISEKDDFVMNSTGTWCVAMHPQEKVQFFEDEIGKQVFFNLSAQGKPVKTSVLMAGLEFETYLTILQKLHNTTEFPGVNEDKLQEALAQKECFIMPGLVKGAGQFPDSDPGVWFKDIWYSYDDIESGKNVPEVFQDFQLSFQYLLLSMVTQTKTALLRVGMKPGMPIYLEGGFSRNRGYRSLLASCFPENPVLLTDLDEATAFGTALTAKAALEQKELKELSQYISFNKTKVELIKTPGLNEFMEAFEAKL